MGQKRNSRILWQDLSPRAARALPDAGFRYEPGFLTRREADRLFVRLGTSIPWEAHSIRLFGRSVPEPRLSAWLGAPHCSYRYSGRVRTPLPPPPLVAQILERVTVRTGLPFNCVLANLYRDGKDSMGWHSDDEPELGPDPAIASLSLGATRRFELRHRTKTDLPVLAFDLEPGSLLVMERGAQAHWSHRVPKQRAAGGSRINLTFRWIGAPGATPPPDAAT